MYKKDDDKLIRIIGEVVEPDHQDGDPMIVIGIYSYKGGQPKLGITRKEGRGDRTRHSAMGRLTKSEVDSLKTFFADLDVDDVFRPEGA